MEIITSIPILKNPVRILKDIAKFWDHVSPGWKEIWGPHIHHGFYENTENNGICPPLVAQEKLLEKLCQLLKPQADNQILDVGCGMGGSSIYLAKNYHAKVIGISLSQNQLNIATKETKKQGLSTVSYKIEDAHTLASFSAETFDIVWSLESCEQFYDKALFIEQAFRVLKPGGKLMLATWCADREFYQGKLARNYQDLCKSFDLPYMPTMEYYKKILEKDYLIETLQDWSAYVKDSWHYAILHLKNYSFFQLLRIAGLSGIKFIRKLNIMNHAFQTGQLRYGLFIAKKPEFPKS